MFGGIGVQELLLIFLVALLLFGSNRIPDIARSLGKGISEFKRAMDEAKGELNRTLEEAPRARPTPEKPVETVPSDLDSVPGNFSPNNQRPAQGTLPDPPAAPQ